MLTTLQLLDRTLSSLDTFDRLTRGVDSATLPEGYTALHRERRAGRFSRSFALSRELDAGAAEARLEDGVLTLTLPRRVASRRSIPVQAA